MLAVLVIAVTASADILDANSGRDRLGVIVDTDMGLDDVRAVLALLADSTVDIDAFITVEGSASVGKATDNLVGLIETVAAGPIEVLMGTENPDLDPPPWRETANALGGAGFPPPRGITPTGAISTGFRDLLEARQETDYLALGPLSNLRAIELQDPGSLALLHTIWLPARLRDNRMTDWNMLYDTKASEMVFGSAREIIVIDISGCDNVDAVSYLSSLEGQSSSVLWIGRLLSDLGPYRGHVMLYDELAAVGYAGRDLLSLADETYSVRMDDEQTFQLVSDPRGNVHVATMADCERALARLRSLWESGPLRHGPAYAENALPVETLLRSFHGHLGPYVVIGYRMGVVALDELESEGHFGISAEVHILLEPPSSCLIDGVQIGSGCTLGKRNIEIFEEVGPAWAVFKSSEGEQVTIRLNPRIPARVQELIDSRGVEGAGRVFLEMRPDSLFATDRTDR